MRAEGSFISGRRLLVVLVLASALAVWGCMPQKTLSRDEIDNRAQEYFLRGMDQYQRGEFRPALESFRLAKAYDLQGTNAAIAEMIEKTEARLRLPSSGAAAAAPQPAPPREARPAPTAPAATPAPKPGYDVPMKTFRSRKYPYQIDIPENWTIDTSAPRVPGLDVEVLTAPKNGSIGPDLSTLAVPLADDVDARAFAEAMRKALRSAGIDPIEVGNRPIDGANASLLRARTSDQLGKHLSTIAMFEIQRVGWLMIFDTAADESDRLQPLFHRMLDSFHISTARQVV